MHSWNNVWLATAPILMSLSLPFNVPCSLRALPYTLSPSHKRPWYSAWTTGENITLEFTGLGMRLGISKAFSIAVGSKEKR